MPNPRETSLLEWMKKQKNVSSPTTLELLDLIISCFEGIQLFRQKQDPKLYWDIDSIFVKGTSKKGFEVSILPLTPDAPVSQTHTVTEGEVNSDLDKNAFVAPEIKGNGTPDSRADLYMVGKIGHWAFSKNYKEQPNPSAAERAVVSRILNLLTLCAAEKPSERPNSISETLSQLKLFRRELMPEEPHYPKVVPSRLGVNQQLILLTCAFIFALILRFSPIASGFSFFSYAFPFLLNHPEAKEDVTILYMDSDSHKALDQPWDSNWDRKLHAQLVNKMADRGAKAVVFDLLFETADSKESDDTFIEACESFGRVVVGAKYQVESLNNGFSSASIALPFKELRDVTFWGVVELADVKERVWGGISSSQDRPALVDQLANIGQFTPLIPLKPHRLINFYGPPGTIRHYSYRDALEDDWIPETAIKDKVVFVGGMSQAGFTGGRKTDDFKTPFTFTSGMRSPGVEVNAVSFLNHIYGESLYRPGLHWDLLAILSSTAIALWIVCRFSRSKSLLCLVLLATTVLIAELFTRSMFHLWLPWGAALGQFPVLWFGRFILFDRQTIEKSPDLRGSNAVKASTPKFPGYQVFSPAIGSGGYGSVWLAKDKVGRYCAIKIIERGKFGTRSRIYEREFDAVRSYAAKNIQHPNLVQLFHVDESEEGFYYVMRAADDLRKGVKINPETYAPKTLSAVLSRTGKMSLDRWKQVADGLLSGLAFLHEHGLVHRDIKPENIVFINGIPCIVDIGIMIIDSSEADLQTMVGSAKYMPEEGKGTTSGDVFALGKILNECLDIDSLPNIQTEADSDTLRKLVTDFLEKATTSTVAVRYSNAEVFRDAYLSVIRASDRKTRS